MFGNVKILHIVSDEKFTDSAYKWFECVAPSCNTFLLPSRKKRMNYIKETPIKVVDPLSFKNPFFMRSLEKYDLIILHSLTVFNQALVTYANPNLKFVWIGMGYDYYDIIYENPHALYQEKTTEIVKRLTINENPVQVLLNKLSKFIFYRNIKKEYAIKRINYFSPVLENEYKLVASKFESNFPEYIAWNYATTSKNMDYFIKNQHITGNNVLVGNSATPENNHLEVFEFLRTLNLNGKQIICPLSYGNSEYANILKHKGREYFGQLFWSVETFMPFHKYIKLISSCSNVIMNHHRQQGSGNISAMLYMGAKIFMNSQNPLFDFYKEKGIVLFSINELFINPSLLDFSLSYMDIEKNRDILKLAYDEKEILNKTEKLIGKILFSSD